MKLKVILIGLVIVLSSNLFAAEIGFDQKGVQTFKVNLLAGDLIFNIDGKTEKGKFLAQIKEDGISGELNLNTNKIENSTGTINIALNDILNPQINESYTKQFLPMLNTEVLAIKLKKLKDLEETEKDNVLKKINFKGKAVCEFAINGQTNEVEIPINLIFLKGSAFTKKRGEGNILTIRGMFDLDISEFDIDIPEDYDQEVKINFNFSGNSGK